MTTRAQTSQIGGAPLRIDRVAKLTGLSQTTIDRLERAGRFPRRRRIATRAVAWAVSEIEDWLENQLVVEVKLVDELFHDFPFAALLDSLPQPVRKRQRRTEP